MTEYQLYLTIDDDNLCHGRIKRIEKEKVYKFSLSHAWSTCMIRSVWDWLLQPRIKSAGEPESP